MIAKLEGNSAQGGVGPLDHLLNLHNNPFIFAPAMYAFYCQLGDRDRSLLLSYLVLPITLHKPCREFLCAANSRSSLRTMMAKNHLLNGIEERVLEHKRLTNLTVQYLLGARDIVLDGTTVKVANDSHPNLVESLTGQVKAAKRFAMFCKEYEVPMIFRMLGVCSL